MNLNVLFEDDHIIVVEKKEGIPTQAGKITEIDMVSELNNYLKKSARDKSSMADLKVYLIHRLDKPVRGILVFAKTSADAAKLNTQMQNNEFKKKYYALVEGKPSKESGELSDFMYKDSVASKSIIVENNNNENSKRAILTYSLVEYDEKIKMFPEIKDRRDIDTFSILDISLLTGRFHQIRCQLSHIGCPIAGDELYGAKSKLKNRKAIGLIAYSLEFNHPVTGKRMSFS